MIIQIKQTNTMTEIESDDDNYYVTESESDDDDNYYVTKNETKNTDDDDDDTYYNKTAIVSEYDLAKYIKNIKCKDYFKNVFTSWKLWTLHECNARYKREKNEWLWQINELKKEVMRNA